MSTAETTCGCGCNSVTLVTETSEACGCGCDCCGTPPKSVEEQITELQRLRESVDRRLRSLEDSTTN